MKSKRPILCCLFAVTAATSPISASSSYSVGGPYHHDDHHQKQQDAAALRNKRRLLLRGSSSPHNTNNQHHHHQQRRKTQEQVSTTYLSDHPYYPNHSTKTCNSDANPPLWMTYTGGYAEKHLFATLQECCEFWFPDNGDCLITDSDNDAGNGDDDENVKVGGEESLNYHQRPASSSSLSTETLEEEFPITENQEEEVSTASVENVTSLQEANDHPQQEQNNNNDDQGNATTSLFPTSSCGRTIFDAQQCTRLCIQATSTSTSPSSCLPDESCFQDILCPSNQVALSMGNAGDEILDLISSSSDNSTRKVNVCGVDYNDAESKCSTPTTNNNSTDGVAATTATTSNHDLIECPDGTGKECPNEQHCYGGILCPISFLMTSSAPSPSPTPMESMTSSSSGITGHNNSDADGGDDDGSGTRPIIAMDASIDEETSTAIATTTTKKDKTEVVGMPSPPRPVLTTASNSTTSTSTTQEGVESTYSIDKATLGTISVASDSCVGGCPPSSTCVGNQAGGQLINDSDCEPCSSAGQTWWPCDVPGLCWCWQDGTDRIAPAPISGLEVDPSIAEEYGSYYTPCDDILSRETFNTIAPNAKHPYTYTGLCDAILTYNAHHTEKAFGMGDAYMRASELAAFLGHTLHESDDLKAPREYLMCGDSKVVNGEVYCKPCDSGSFDWEMQKCAGDGLAAGGNFSEYCQPSSKPPEACSCNESVESIDDGYVPAKELFFGRGAIQLSWSYNYRSASTALTGDPETFCENPDLVASTEEYAWGAGLYFWQEHVKEGTTSHIECLKNYNFGGTLNNINGGLECPTSGGWHEEAVKLRLNRYCRAAKALGLPNLLGLTGCAGLEVKFQLCVADGSCSDCHDFFDKNPGEHSDTYSPPVSSPKTASVAAQPPFVPEEKPEESLSSCPQDLIAWEKNPSCCVPNPKFIGDGACDPDAPYNTAECNYDGGDCCKETCDRESIFGCTTKEESQYGVYGPFGFYCVDPSQENSIDPSTCINVEKDSIGDGMCNPDYNTAECNYDGGDCCEDSCDNMHSYYQCGSGLQSFDCVDPAFIKENEETDTKEPTPPSKATTSTSSKATSTLTTSPIQHTHTCHKDMLECDGGTFVSRNPEKNCDFFPCPTKSGSESSLTNGSPTPHPTESKETCGEDRLECSGGHFVFRDPGNNCHWFPCPEPETPKPSPHPIPPKPSPHPTEQKIHTMAVLVHEKLSSYPGCPGEVFLCPDGHYVGMDPENGCQYFPCKIDSSNSEESEQMSSMSSATMTHEKFTPNIPQSLQTTHNKKRENES